MATRLQGTYYSAIHGHQFDIDIDDSTYASSALDFTVLNLVFNWHGINEQRFNPIMTSSVDVVINIDSSALNSFVSDLVGAEEERFTIKIEKNSSLYWVGIVLVDEIRRQDRPYGSGYAFTLSATDGIGRLKDVNYNNSGTAYTGKETVMAHLFNVLGKINLDSYWGVSDTYLTSVVDWWESLHVFANNTDPLTVSRFDHRALIHLDRNANQSYFSAFDVLKMICTQWGARFFHANGRYYLIQVNEYADTGTVHLRHFVKAGTYNGNTLSTSFAVYDKNWGNADQYENGNGSYDLVGLEPAELTYFPPLNHVAIDYRHSSIQNIAVDAAWDDTSQPTYTIDEVDSNSQTAKLLFSFNLTYKATYTVPADFLPAHFKFQFLVSIDDGAGTIYYLKRTATKASTGNVTYGSAQWIQTTVSYWEWFPIVSYTDDLAQTQTFGDITPPLPQDGELDIQVTFVRAYNAANTNIIDGGDYTETWSVTSFYLEALIDGSLESQFDTTGYRVDNDTSGNTAKIELSFLMGDGPTGNALGHYEAYDGSSWSNSSAWRVGSSGGYDYEINELLATEIISGQLSPVLKWIGTVRGDIEIYSTLVRDSMQLIALGAKYDAGIDEWNGEWFQISTDSSSTVITPTQRKGGPPIGVIPPPGNPPGPDDPFPPSEEMPVIVIGGPYSPPGLAGPTYTDISITQTNINISEGDTVTTININAIGFDNAIRAGDEIVLFNIITGESQVFTVDSDVSSTDTQISVTSETSDFDFPDGSAVTILFSSLFSRVNQIGNPFVEYFPGTSGTSVTVTENSGNLPGNTALIDVHVNKIIQYEGSSRDYEVSGSDINFTYTLANDHVRVKFTYPQ